MDRHSPKRSPIILVCGFGRCGSSLIMQMLKAGGINATGDAPGHEVPQVIPGHWDPEWIRQQKGSAVKILDPQRPELKLLPGDYIPIWLERDRKQQAKSQIKFLEMVGDFDVTDHRMARRMLVKSYGKDLPVALKIMRSLGLLLRLRFEDILTDPYGSATLLAHHCSIDRSRINAMRDIVLSREPKCQPGLDIEIELTRKAIA